ncbi:MAG: HEAT repeat domain-containing protein [Deltaproteobacteria bacterium]|nr:HEAT repeat domain-containing protein [Deltaproteobacteria bacterium]
MALELVNYANILNELNKAVKMHNFYPDGHPNFESALGKCFVVLKKCLDEQSEFTWVIDQKGFYSNKIPIAAGNREIILLARKLFFRRIKEITFKSRTSIEELKVFLSILKLEPEDLQERGGFETIFAEHDIIGIQLNELRYEDLKKLKKEMEDKKQGEKQAAAQKKTEEDQIGEADKSKEDVKPPEPEKPDEEAPLEALIERIRKEKDFLRYNDLSARIREKANILLLEKKFLEAFPVLLLFAEHSMASSYLTDEIRNTATDRLRSLINREITQFLVAKVGSKEEANRLAIQHMLLTAGMDSVDYLLDAIIVAPEAVTRRHLFNTLVLFGPNIRLLVEQRLNSPEWYVVRQMVSLLGEIGDPGALDAIESAYKNPDVRVKREVLKGLIKIPSPRSTELIMRALGEEDESIVIQAIISLGMLKDITAIDALGEIALRREPFADKQEPKKEAIKALGIIGNTRCVPYLTKVLFKKVWFGKKSNEEIRALAAQSLGMIGGPEAYAAVREACADSEGELYLACKRILDGRERINERN